MHAPLAASEQAMTLTLVSRIGLYGEAQDQMLFRLELVMKEFTVAQYKDFNERVKGAFWTISYTILSSVSMA